MSANRRPETDVLLRCAAVDRNGDGDAWLDELGHAPLDWPWLLRLALRHGVLALLAHRLLRAAPGVVPAEPLAYLSRHLEKNTRRNQVLAGELRRLLHRLRQCGVEAVPGRATALPDPRLDLVDIDLLVRPQDVAAARGCLIAAGYSADDSAWRAQVHAMVRWDHQLRFLAGNTTLVLRWRPGPVAIGFGIDMDDLWQPAASAPSAGNAPATLPAEALLCFSAIRGALNRWQRLAWLHEVAALLADPRVDLPRAMALARSFGSRRALDLALALAADLLAAPVPPDARESGDPCVSATMQVVRAEILAPLPPRPSVRDVWRFHLAIRDGARARVMYAARRAVTPTVADVAAWPRAARLPLVHSLVRPLRLAGRIRHVVYRPVRERTGDLARFGRSPVHVVRRMLTLADVGPDDVVYDLGCGDGRVLITAARERGSRGVGVDLHGELVERSRRNAHRAGVAHLVEFRRDDARLTDLAPATVVFLYLSVAGTLALRESLMRRLSPGTRVVSLNFDMGDWLPDETEVVDEASWGTNTIYLWRHGRAASRTPSDDQQPAPTTRLASSP
jgi:hypothetical protein